MEKLGIWLLKSRGYHVAMVGDEDLGKLDNGCEFADFQSVGTLSTVKLTQFISVIKLCQNAYVKRNKDQPF